MTTTFSELQTMQDSLSGGTTNLLRMARSGCGCAVAFVALALEDQTFATARYSSTPDEGLVGREALDEVVAQVWHDPRIARGEPVTRSLHLGGRWTGRGGSPLAVAVVPLGEGGEPWGMVGVADPGDKIFGPSDIELLGRIAKRMASYLRARHEVQQQAADAVTYGTVPTATPPAGHGADSATRSELWWAVESPERAAAAGDRPAPPTTWAALAAEAAHELRGTMDAGPRGGEAGTFPPAPPVVPTVSRFPSGPPAPPSFRARVVAESPDEAAPAA
ncbi:MAG: GAF domain-containing protein, partial [Acidimicrobiales bacterium]